MERLRGNLRDDGDDKDADEDDAADRVAEIQRHRDGIAAGFSKVVARILMIQKTRVTSGTLLGAAATADTLPVLPTDPGDRNRTSPFAFTGNRFEFHRARAPCNQSPARW